MSESSFDGRLDKLVAVQVSGQRLARVLAEHVAPHWSLKLIVATTKVVELLRLLVLEPATPHSPLLRGYLVDAVKAAMDVIDGAEAATIVRLGQEHIIIVLFPALRGLLADAAADHMPKLAPHPATAPPLNHTHKSRRKPGGR